jgi:putative endopeptidase
MKSPARRLVAALASAALAAITLTTVAAAVETDGHGLDVAAMDTAVKPGDDFDAYANGGWEKRAVIPPDRASWGAFAELRELADKRTAALVEEAAKSNAPAGSDARKVGDFYASFMDEAAIEGKGLAPLEPELHRIAAVADKKALAEVLGRSLRADVDPLNNTNFHTENLFGLWVAPGFADPHHYMGYLLQGGLGLPDREYYLSPAPRMAEVRVKYEAHVAAMLTLAGLADAAAQAKKVMALETAIAHVHISREQSGEVLKANNTWTRAQFATNAPGLDWNAFFDGAGLGAATAFIVWQPSAFTGEAKLVNDTPLDVWKSWLAFHLVDEAADVLPKRFSDEHFAFYGKSLVGTPKQLERWKRGVAATNHALGDAVGALYAKRWFPPAAKATARAMVAEIVKAFGKRIDALDWMTPATKARAKAKLTTLYVGIGYPETWRDYKKLEVVRGDALGNWTRARQHEYAYRVGLLGKPVDRTLWSMTPQTVNAVNLPLQNALDFPAAILEPPFFDAKADAAVNYGGIGSVIGHEISHSFDDEGSQFDADGKLTDWWTKDDLAHFKAASARLVAQYNAYKPFPDLAINGKLTLGENIADVAGLSAALDGWHASLGGKRAPAAQGFSGEQRFFLAFAQTRRSVTREPMLRRLILTDGHAPGRWRAQTVRNLDGWYDAFAVKPGQALYLPPADRIRVW